MDGARRENNFYQEKVTDTEACTYLLPNNFLDNNSLLQF